jgi:hypothetical protein
LRKKSELEIRELWVSQKHQEPAVFMKELVVRKAGFGNFQKS